MFTPVFKKTNQKRQISENNYNTTKNNYTTTKKQLRKLQNNYTTTKNNYTTTPTPPNTTTKITKQLQTTKTQLHNNSVTSKHNYKTILEVVTSVVLHTILFVVVLEIL